MQINIQWQKSSVIKTYGNLTENKLEVSVIRGIWELLYVDTHWAQYTVILKHICSQTPVL